MILENVFNQRDNKNIVNFSDQSGSIDFSAASRMLVKFDGSVVEADTDIDPTLIDYSIGGGDVSFSFGFLGVLEGKYPASVIVYDGSHPNGQILVHATLQNLFFKFVDPI